MDVSGWKSSNNNNNAANYVQYLNLKAKHKSLFMYRSHINILYV